MIAALGKADNDVVRGVIGRELTKLPASPASVKALETAFEKVGVDALMPDGNPVKVSLAVAAEKFMDPEIVPWLLQSVATLKTAKGEKENIENTRVALLQTAVKLMNEAQAAGVKKTVDAVGDDLIKAAHLQASRLLDDCKLNASCYLARIEDPALQERSNQFVAIRAVYTLGYLVSDGTKAEIVKRLPRIKNDSIRAEALNAIDHLSPNGDRKTADDLQAILDEQATRGKTTPVDSMMRQIMTRLRARAA